MQKKIMYGSILLCIVLWIIAIVNKGYLIEFMIKDTFILIEYTLIPIYVSGIIALILLFNLVKKALLNRV